MTLSHETCLVHFEMDIYLTFANSISYFDIKMKKLWPYEAVKHHGGYFEKTALEDFVCHFAYIP